MGSGRRSKSTGSGQPEEAGFGDLGPMSKISHGEGVREEFQVAMPINKEEISSETSGDMLAMFERMRSHFRVTTG